MLLRLLLLEHSSSSPSVAARLSELQATAVVGVIPSAKLDSQQCLVLAKLALDVPCVWEIDKKNNAMGALKPADATKTTGPKQRRAMQSYTNIRTYSAGHMWEAMLDKSVASDTRLTALLGHCIKFGSRCPSERISKWLGS